MKSHKLKSDIISYSKDSQYQILTERELVFLKPSQWANTIVNITMRQEIDLDDTCKALQSNLGRRKELKSQTILQDRIGQMLGVLSMTEKGWGFPRLLSAYKPNCPSPLLLPIERFSFAKLPSSFRR